MFAAPPNTPRGPPPPDKGKDSNIKGTPKKSKSKSKEGRRSRQRKRKEDESPSSHDPEERYRRGPYPHPQPLLPPGTLPEPPRMVLLQRKPGELPPKLIQGGQGHGYYNNREGISGPRLRPPMPMPLTSYNIPPRPKSPLPNIPNPPLIHTDAPFTYVLHSFQLGRGNWIADPMFQKYKRLPIPDQIAHLVDAMTLTKNGFDRRVRVLSHMRDILRRDFPRCVLFPFGSFLTGLNDSTSDMDVYFDAFGTSRGFTPPAEFCSVRDVFEVCLKSLRRAKCPEEFRAFTNQLVPVREARVPILKMVHHSGLNIDLSFENLISYKNSELIELFMQINPVVRPLTILIRYWGKFHNITGSNYIKNYCLILLIIVFLNKKRILPTIEELQKMKTADGKTAPQRNDIIDGWNTRFVRDVKLIRKSCQLSQAMEPEDTSNWEVVLRLLKEFFQMYADFDFSSQVICSYTGQVMEKSKFKAGNEESLPESLERYKDWAMQQPTTHRLKIRAPMCVQDPFVLSYNVAGSTPFGIVLKFQVACRESADTIKPPLSFLLDIFLRLPPEVGERRFLNMQDNHKKTLDVRQEIEHFFEIGDFPEPRLLPDEEEFTHPEETLKLYQYSVGQLVDKSTVRFGTGWERFYTFELSQNFLLIFGQAVSAHDIAHLQSNHVWLQKAETLWCQLVTDLLEIFWEKCMKLTVESRQRKAKDGRFTPGTSVSKKYRKREILFYDCLKRQNSSENSSQDNSQESKLYQKITDLGDYKVGVVCERFQCSTVNPVWKSRLEVYNGLAVDQLRADGYDGRSPIKMAKGSKKKIHCPALESQDPLAVEEMITNAILEKEPTGQDIRRRLLKFNVYTKIENTHVENVPTLYFVVDKAEGVHEDLYVTGARRIVETFQDILEPYVLFHLKKWLKIDDEAKRKLEEETRARLVSLRNEEFDLLMPPSSSSSSDEGDDDAIEEPSQPSTF